MKRSNLIQVAGVIYVSFAILVAYTSVPSDIQSGKSNLDSRINNQQIEQPLCFDQQMDRFDTYIFPRDKYEEYTITVWTSPTCLPCKKYIREEVPALLKAGFIVYIFDSEMVPPPEYVRAFPTVTISNGGELLLVDNYFKARDIKKFVDARTELKGV